MENKRKRQNKMKIASARWGQSVSQPILLLLPPSFVSDRLREKLQLCSCLVLHKSHRGKFMDDRCWRKWGLFPLFHRLHTQGRGFAVTGSDPELTSPCVATETEELRKREEARQWGVTTRRSEGREERSGVCLFMYNCLCLPLCQSCCLSSRHRHLWQTHTETHAAAVVCSCTSAWSQRYSYSWSGSLQSAPPVTRRSFFRHSWLPPRWRVGSQARPTGWFWTIT